MQHFISEVLMAIAVPLVAYVLSKLAPYHAPPETRHYTLASLTPIYAKWEFITLGLVFILVPLIGYAIFSVLQAAMAFALKRFEHAPYVLSPTGIFWALPAGFLALIMTSPLLELILRRLLKERYLEFDIYQQLKYKFDAKKIGKVLVNFITVICGAFLILTFNFYIVFDSTQIISNDFFSFTDERYLYSEIRSIQIESIGSTQHQPPTTTQYLIEFHNGKRWHTRLWPIELDEAFGRQVMGFVSAGSGIPISPPAQ